MYLLPNKFENYHNLKNCNKNSVHSIDFVNTDFNLEHKIFLLNTDGFIYNWNLDP